FMFFFSRLLGDAFKAAGIKDSSRALITSYAVSSILTTVSWLYIFLMVTLFISSKALPDNGFSPSIKDRLCIPVSIESRLFIYSSTQLSVRKLIHLARR